MINIQYPMIKECGNRRGVALIVVLGFLTIMILMALAFLTQARVERLVSSSSLEGMRTRQLAQTAIAAAMQDYLNALKTVSPAETKNDIFLSGDGQVSLSYYYSNELLGDDRLLIGKVEDWLQDRHLAAALGNDESNAVRNAEWIWVREKPGTRSRILGRYAYACFDMSGLLDANLLGTAYGDDVPQFGDSTNRNNVRKMVYEALSQSAGGASQLKLNQYQRIWKGFDTPAALLNLTDGRVNDGRNSGENRWGADMDETPVGSVSVSSLSAYSYAVLHRADGSGKEKIQATASAIQNDPDFSQILGGGSRNDVIKALQDYESTDLAPQGVNYPSVKNVPMFNEIGVQAELKETSVGGGNSTYNLILRMRIEFWYPFPSKDNELGGTFTMPIPTVGGSSQLAGAADVWVQLTGVSGGYVPLTTTLGSSVPGSGLTVPAKFNGNEPYFAQNAVGDNLVFTVPLADATGVAVLPSGMQLQVNNVQITHPLVLNSGQPVDATPQGQPLDIPLSSPPLPANTPTPWMSLAVEDPRLNHLFGSWLLEDPPTFGSINKAAQDAIDHVTGIPPGTNLFCRNGPIERPGELGYLSTGRPWETLDIFSDGGIRLMNRMICDEDLYNLLQKNKAFFTNGTINPYTRRTNVLNAAFYGVDIREVPGMDGEPKNTERLNGNTLKTVVALMMDAPVKNGYGGWGKILADTHFPTDFNKNMRIAALDNTWGLFNESDRLFVVAVMAQSIKEGGGDAGLGNWDAGEDVITGERRAVALCWMDGSAEGSGNTLLQEMNIIMFQYLNE